MLVKEEQLRRIRFMCRQLNIKVDGLNVSLDEAILKMKLATKLVGILVENVDRL